MHLSSLLIYPVKALRGCPVNCAAIDERGIAGDRRFMVVDPEGRFLTQRTLPRMALIATRLDENELTLSAAGREDIRVPRGSQPDAEPIRVSVWKSEGLAAEDCGQDAADWLGDFLGTRCRLVRAGARFQRPVRRAPAGLGDRQVGFADGFPGLLVTEASLADLNDRLLERGVVPVPMDRFRPNLVIAGAAPYAEDTWKRVRIGNAVFYAAGPCARCGVITTDQATGARDTEPLRTLAEYRRDPAKPEDVNFGQNVIPESTQGLIQVGDSVTVGD